MVVSGELSASPGGGWGWDSAAKSADSSGGGQERDPVPPGPTAFLQSRPSGSAARVLPSDFRSVFQERPHVALLGAKGQLETLIVCSLASPRYFPKTPEAPRGHRGLNPQIWALFWFCHRRRFGHSSQSLTRTGMLPSGCCLRRMVVLWGHRMLARGFSLWSLELLKKERSEEHQLDGELGEFGAGERPFRAWAVPNLNILKGFCGF